MSIVGDSARSSYGIKLVSVFNALAVCTYTMNELLAAFIMFYYCYVYLYYDDLAVPMQSHP